MKKLTWRTMDVTGPGIQILDVPEVFSAAGRYQNLPDGGDVEPWSFYVATLAVRLPDADRSMKDMGARVSASGGRFTVEQLTNGDYADAEILPPGPGGYAWIEYSFDHPETIRSLTFAGGHTRSQFADPSPSYDHYLEASDDGRNWRRVCSIPSDNLPVLTMTLPATTARHFRLMVKNPEGAAAGKGTQIPEFVLYPVVRVNHAEDKAGFAAPHDFTDYVTPETDTPVLEVQDLRYIDWDGPIIWKVPEGRWRIYRFGMSLTGKKNHPAPPDATGLEVDKLDPEAWEAYFKEYFRIYSDLPIQYLLTDSYEAGQMTWTRNMFAEFKERRGYDLFPWLPALTGQILSGTDATERFLFDWRQTLAELFTENYDRLGDLAREAGMLGRYTESHENGRVFVGDGMDLKRSADIPMSAIWMDDAGTGSTLAMAKADIRESASVAHVYGQNLVAAESFTTSGRGGKSYSYCPENMKYTADVALSCGLNRFVIHESSHQPSDTYVPGLDLIGYGQWFNRHDTWAEEARAWTDYLARSSFLLQQGRFKADILYYYGEDNCITGLFGHELPDIPAGYAYDFIQPSGLQNAVFPLDGKLETESGMTYRMLVLGPNCRTMSVKVLRRIVYLAKAGVPVCGTLPERPASFGDQEGEFDGLLAELRERILDVPLAEALRRSGIEPDFTGPRNWAFVHRETDREDIYWIRNFSGRAAGADIRLNAGLGQPLLLDPATGRSRALDCTREQEGKCSLYLDMEANDALFVVIPKLEGKTEPVTREVRVPALTLDGSWNLSFDSGRGAPPTMIFDRLCSYTESDLPSVRYYSGTVTYRKDMKLSGKHLRGAKSFEIDLGEVKNLARVSVNGYDLGVAWKTPFRVEVPTSYLHTGINRLEVKVINLWPNRIIGDLQPGRGKRWTRSGAEFYTADSPLRPSGLLGPVRLLRIE